MTEVIIKLLPLLLDGTIFVLAACHLYRTPVHSPYFMFFFLFCVGYGWATVNDVEVLIKVFDVLADGLLSPATRLLIIKGTVAAAMVWITVKKQQA